MSEPQGTSRHYLTLKPQLRDGNTRVKRTEGTHRATRCWLELARAHTQGSWLWCQGLLFSLRQWFSNLMFSSRILSPNETLGKPWFTEQIEGARRPGGPTHNPDLLSGPAAPLRRPGVSWDCIWKRLLLHSAVPHTGKCQMDWSGVVNVSTQITRLLNVQKTGEVGYS